MKVITISREYGAGGQNIAKRVAEELGITIYDKDIVRETVKASGFDFDMVRKEEEEVSKTMSFFKGLWASSAFYPDPQEVIHDVQKAVILKFAKEGPCVILGRGADESMRNAGIDSLNVFIHAPGFSKSSIAVEEHIVTVEHIHDGVTLLRILHIGIG